uniref:Uncharacterized protein n=1 Tax=Knipowitschia caucasica TaxID=637954 RepID=A0AAV2JVK2_KNICA
MMSPSEVMAAEISCLTGVDTDDKDADPEINALMLMQEPLRMTSCTDAFSKSLGQPNGVLDVLSSEDMLSPVGLGNGPSVHQPTEAHELNSFSNDKEEEKNITPLKTVQEIGVMETLLERNLKKKPCYLIAQRDGNGKWTWL